MGSGASTKGPRSGGVTPNGLVRVRLLEFETSSLIMAETGVSSITYFEGDRVAATACLRERLVAVLEANRWLLGRITRKNKECVLEYDSEADVATHMDAVFFEGAALAYNTEYAPLGKVATKSGALIEKGKKLVNKVDKVLLKLTVFPCSDDPAKFAVVLSVSHIVADGHTYYMLLNMMWEGSKVEALQVARVYKHTEAAATAVGTETIDLFKSKAVMVSLAARLILGPKAKIACHLVDNAKVKVLKEKALAGPNGDVPFLSTNDILTAYFSKLTKSRIYMMAINLRDRLPSVPEVTRTRAGNYESIIFMTNHDSSHPADIRRTLLKPGHYRRIGAEPSPKGLKKLTARMGGVTNWASSAEPPCLPGCETVIHLPLYDVSVGTPFEGAIFFLARKGELGCLMFTQYLSSEAVARLSATPECPFGAKFPGKFFP